MKMIRPSSLRRRRLVRWPLCRAAGALARSFARAVCAGRHATHPVYRQQQSALFRGREDMMARMQQVGVASAMLVLPETPHSFWMFDPWLQPTVDATIAFLNQQLPER
jgi:hypothetical protein